ncbi:alpha/beta fold hydrolase [Oryzobacter telluris]|uniref:alpha/beta hydrolase n=1 Tax=Oryzobacter telluris TaxID=3149179 RepID=UPI00370D07E1
MSGSGPGVETRGSLGGPGVEFTETMRGFASTTVTDDYRSGAEQGERDGSVLDFTVTVTADDARRLVDEPEHQGRINGTVTAPALSPNPIRVSDGRFNLLVRDSGTARGRRMLYAMPMVTDEGRHLHLDGYKQIEDDGGLDLWADTTTLYVTVREGDAHGDVVARGILTIHPADFARQLTTMKAVGADGPLDHLAAMTRFGRYFAGSLNEVFGGVFAHQSPFSPDAPPRVRRQLRCGTPEVHDFRTEDGVGLRLTRFRGGDKGPVLLSPGFGTSSLAYLLDTTETNFPEYLVEQGYDVWILDYRASPALPSASTQFTLDDIARYDYPAAVATVREVTGAETVQVVAHCIGSVTLLMALALGLKGVRHAVSSVVTFHPRSGTVNALRSGIHAADALQALGVDTLTTDVDRDPSWAERLYDAALHLYPAGEEQCGLPFCRRVMFTYGEVYDHDQLNDATHRHLHEAFGVANMTTFKQITLALRTGHVVAADGSDDYVTALGNLALPITFLHGENNRLFLPEGSRLTYEALREANDPDLYTRHVIPGYAHMDLFIGKDAARDVYPVITAELDRHA